MGVQECKSVVRESQLRPTRSNLFDTQMVFLKLLFQKVDLEKISRRQKSMRISQGTKSYYIGKVQVKVQTLHYQIVL